MYNRDMLRFDRNNLAVRVEGILWAIIDLDSGKVEKKLWPEVVRWLCELVEDFCGPWKVKVMKVREEPDKVVVVTDHGEWVFNDSL